MHKYTQQTLLRAGVGLAPAVTLGLAGGSQSQDADSWRFAAAGSGRTDGRRGAGARAAKARAAASLAAGTPGRSQQSGRVPGVSACTPGRRPAPAPTTRKGRERWPGPEAQRPGRRLRGVHRLRSTDLGWGGGLASTPSRTHGRTHRTAGQIGPGSRCQGVTRKQKRLASAPGFTAQAGRVRGRLRAGQCERAECACADCGRWWVLKTFLRSWTHSPVAAYRTWARSLDHS